MRISDWSSDVCSSAPSASRRPDADAAIDVPMTAVAQREVIIVERGNTVRLPDNLAEHFTSHMLAAASVNLHAVAGGSGPALLLIGAWPQTWYTWRAFMPHLLSEGFSVIEVDGSEERRVG